MLSPMIPGTQEQSPAGPAWIDTTPIPEAIVQPAPAAPPTTPMVEKVTVIAAPVTSYAGGHLVDIGMLVIFTCTVAYLVLKRVLRPIADREPAPRRGFNEHMDRAAFVARYGAGEVTGRSSPRADMAPTQFAERFP
jgi:hypothetical protein